MDRKQADRQKPVSETVELVGQPVMAVLQVQKQGIPWTPPEPAKKS